MRDKNFLRRLSIYPVILICSLLYVLKIDFKYINKSHFKPTDSQQEMIDFAVVKISEHLNMDISNIKQRVFFDFTDHNRTQWLCGGDRPAAGCFQPLVNRIVVLWDLSYGNVELCDTIVHELIHATSYYLLHEDGDTPHTKYALIYDFLASKWCSEKY